MEDTPATSAAPAAQGSEEPVDGTLPHLDTQRENSPLVFQDERKQVIHSDSDDATGEEDYEVAEGGGSAAPSEGENDAGGADAAYETDESDAGMDIMAAAITRGDTRKRSRTLSDPNAAEPEAAAVAANASDKQSSDKDEEIVMVDFDFCDPKEADFHGIKALLKSGICAHFNLSELADAVIRQTGVGTTIKVNDEDTVFAVMSALNFASSCSSSPTLLKMRDFLISSCTYAEDREVLSRALNRDAVDASSVALVLSERFVNMPPEISPVLLQGLLDDLTWAAKNAGTNAEQRKPFTCNNFLFVSRCFVDASKQRLRKKARFGDASGAAAAAAAAGAPLVYHLRFEDEILQERAVLSFTFPTARAEALQKSETLRSASTREQGFGEESYQAMLLTREKIQEAIAHMQAELQHATHA